MIAFPPAKINIGLDVLEKRADGFHAIRSVFYPIPLYDILEIVKDESLNGPVLSLSGIPVDGDASQNLVVKAYHLLAQDHALPGVRMHLRKNIPIGAGLGGGSSDGTLALRTLDTLFDLGLSKEVLHAHASELGSDCPFFLSDGAMLVEGRGEVMHPHALDLSGKHLTLVMPPFGVSTAEAYGSIQPTFCEDRLSDLASQPLEQWNALAINRFESGDLEAYGEVRRIKAALTAAGAHFCSMTGSGAAVFGIADTPIDFQSPISGCNIFQLAL